MNLKSRYLTKQKKRTPQALRICLDEFRKSWDDLDKLSKINDKWSQLIGIELFNECKPLKIEKKILTIAVNNPQWRQALMYNKHKLKEEILKIGINLNEIKIIQNYERKNLKMTAPNAKLIWEQHPIRVNKNKMCLCKFCNCPTPSGEISRWGKCTFCWRKDL